MAQIESRSVELTMLNPVAIKWLVVNATSHSLQFRESAPVSIVQKGWVCPRVLLEKYGEIIRLPGFERRKVASG